jgi:DNA-binding CsgD family transcriptional regulator
MSMAESTRTVDLGAREWPARPRDATATSASASAWRRARRVLRAPSRRAAAFGSDLVAALLVLAILASTAASGGHNVTGAPFLLAAPVWMISRTHGCAAAATTAGPLAAIVWAMWQHAAIAARLNVVVILALAVFAGHDSRRRARRAGTRPDPRGAGRKNLTSRELEVLSMLATGHTNKEIAARLGLSVRTIESHRARIVSKLGCCGRADLFRAARELGLLDAAGLAAS